MASGGHLVCQNITFDRISRHFRWNANNIFFNYLLSQNVHLGPFWMPENHFQSICNFILQNGCMRPFLKPENHLSSHFTPFYTNTQISSRCRFPKFIFDPISRHFISIHNFVFTKWSPAAILDAQNHFIRSFLIFFLQNGRRQPFSSLVCQWLHQKWVWWVNIGWGYGVHKFSQYFGFSFSV